MCADVSLFGLRKDGTEFPAEISLSSIRIGAVVLTMTAIRDITDRLLADARSQHELHRRAIVGAMLAGDEAERSRIATALHDDTVQVMAAALCRPRPGRPDGGALRRCRRGRARLRQVVT